MSLAIDIDKVRRVLLADGWHDCDGIILDAYEYLWWPNGQKDPDSFQIEHGGGRSGICPTGFHFDEPRANDETVSVFGPLTSILAVTY